MPHQKPLDLWPADFPSFTPTNCAADGSMVSLMNKRKRNILGVQDMIGDSHLTASTGLNDQIPRLVVKPQNLCEAHFACCPCRVKQKKETSN